MPLLPPAVAAVPFFAHPPNPCHCVTPTEMAKDLLLGYEDEDPTRHEPDYRVNGGTSTAPAAGNFHHHRYHHQQVPLLPSPHYHHHHAQQQRKRKERSDSSSLRHFESSSSIAVQVTAKFQKTQDTNKFESVLDRPFIYRRRLDQVLLEALTLFDSAWKNSEARNRLITHLIHFLELKIGLDVHISQWLMPTRVIEQAWRALVLETDLYQQVIYYIQDFHGRPRKILAYSSLKRQQLPPEELRDVLKRTQSFFKCYFQECMPESIKDELPIQEVHHQRRSEDDNKPPAIFLLPRFAQQRKTTSYAMVDLQQPVLADAIIEDSDSESSDDDDEEELLGLDFLNIDQQLQKARQDEKQHEDYNNVDGMMNIDSSSCPSVVPPTVSSSSEEEMWQVQPMLEEHVLKKEKNKNNNVDCLQQQQDRTTPSNTMDIAFAGATTSRSATSSFPMVPMTPVPSSKPSIYSGTSLMFQKEQPERKKNSYYYIDDHDGTATATSTTMDTTITVTTTSVRETPAAAVVVPTITSPAIYSAAAASAAVATATSPLHVASACHMPIKPKPKKKKNSRSGDDIPRVIYTPGSGKPPTVYSGRLLHPRRFNHDDVMSTTTMYSGTPL